MEWVDWSDALVRASSWLDGLYAQLLVDRQVPRALGALYQGLLFLRRRWDREEWRRFCLETARSHPLSQLLMQCPYTRHSLERPRGYAGDADLIDYCYSERRADTLLGQAIYHFLHRQPGPRSVRERRRILAQEIDGVAERVQRPRVLSVACGHLREAKFARAVTEHRLGELIAFDQDTLSLEEVARQHAGDPVRPQCGTVRSILLGRTTFSELDLIYSAGLYDYLSESVASRLTRLLFGMLRPGGRLVVANFAPCTPDTGYLEAFMDWWLVYRDEPQMQALAHGIDPRQIAAQEMVRDSGRNVIYLSLTRK